MGGMLKHLFWIAPLGVLILVMTWFLNRENVVDIRVQDQAFDRDWNESMAGLIRDPGQKAKHLQRAAVSQSRYSAAIIEQEQNRQQMKQREVDVDRAVGDLDRQLNEKMGDK